MKTKRKVILWNSATSDLLTNGKVGGIGVQLLFWGQAFLDNGWRVYSFYHDIHPEEDNLLRCKWIKHFETKFWYSFLYFFFAFWIFLRIRPNLVICRGGADRNIVFIAFWARIFRTKCVIFFGSDVDLSTDFSKCSLSRKINSRIFHLGLHLIKYFVVQNDVQHQQLISMLGNVNVLQIPNIWGNICNSNKNLPREDKQYILWVGNTRALKRPKWVFELAKYLPNERFVMIGGNSDNDVYQECLRLNRDFPNVDFIGGQTFFETNNYFANAKLLICTSEYEGFPNTFLQAWSKNVPVLSTVNPSGRISKYNLGRVCNNVDEFVDAIKELEDRKHYLDICNDIDHYFVDAHSSKAGYSRLIDFLHLPK